MFYLKRLTIIVSFQTKRYQAIEFYYKKKYRRFNWMVMRWANNVHTNTSHCRQRTGKHMERFKSNQVSEATFLLYLEKTPVSTVLSLIFNLKHNFQKWLMRSFKQKKHWRRRRTWPWNRASSVSLPGFDKSWWPSWLKMFFYDVCEFEA